jgi:hypothetical protein
MFVYHRDNPSFSDSFDLGTAVHTLILEPHLSSQIVCVDKPSGASKKGKAFLYLEKQEFNEEFEKKYANEIEEVKNEFHDYLSNPSAYLNLKPEDYKKARLMEHSLLFNPIARELIYTETKREELRLFDFKNIKMKAQLDVINSNYVLDLKTTSKPLNEYEISKAIRNYMYDFQAAAYLTADCGEDMINLGLKKDYYIVFVGSYPPYPTQVIKLSDKVLERGFELFNKAAEIYNDTLETNSEFKTIHDIKVI